MALHRQMRKEIINLLVNHVKGASQQNAMLSAVFFDHPARHSIPAGTDPNTFAVTLLDAAARETIEGEPGVVVLLDELRGRVGINTARKIDAMIAEVREGTADSGHGAADGPAGTPPAVPDGNGGMNFNIRGNVTGKNVNIGGTQHINGDMNLSDDDD